MASRKVSPVTRRGAAGVVAGLRRRGRPLSAHPATLLHIGTLRLKPALYAEHTQLLDALNHPPPGMSRKQRAVQLMLAGLNGMAVPGAGEAVPGLPDAPETDGFLDV